MNALAVSADLLKPAALPSTAKAAVTGDETAKRTKIASVAKDFESQFLSVMLGQMFQGTEISAPFGGGEGEAAFKSFLTDAYAKGIAKHGGIGVAGSIQREMLKLQGLS